MTQEHGGFQPLDEQPRQPLLPWGRPQDRAITRLEQAARRLYGRPRRRRLAPLLALLVPFLTGVGTLALGNIRPGPPSIVAEQERAPAPAVAEPVPVVPESVPAVAAPPLPPILQKIAACESRNTHYDRHGRVLRGRKNPQDVGKYQINTAVWGTVAAQQGYDLYDEQGNEQMARYLLAHYGSVPWRHSAGCWVRR
jgi:hypothetical protein